MEQQSNNHQSHRRYSFIIDPLAHDPTVANYLLLHRHISFFILFNDQEAKEIQRLRRDKAVRWATGRGNNEVTDEGVHRGRSVGNKKVD